MCEHTVSRWCFNQLSYAPVVKGRSVAGLGGVLPISRSRACSHEDAVLNATEWHPVPGEQVRPKLPEPFTHFFFGLTLAVRSSLKYSTLSP
jgi:hypothetical protein